MEQKIIRIIAIMNNLKHNINPSYHNKEYQDWCNRNQLDKKVRFRDWVIIGATKDIKTVLDNKQLEQGETNG